MKLLICCNNLYNTVYLLIKKRTKSGCKLYLNNQILCLSVIVMQHATSVFRVSDLTLKWRCWISRVYSFHYMYIQEKLL
jgi:hypothetical protein